METIIISLAVACIIMGAFILKQFGEISDAINELERLQILVTKLQEMNDRLKDYKELYRLHLKNEAAKNNHSFN